MHVLRTFRYGYGKISAFICVKTPRKVHFTEKTVLISVGTLPTPVNSCTRNATEPGTVGSVRSVRLETQFKEQIKQSIRYDILCLLNKFKTFLTAATLLMELNNQQQLCSVMENTEHTVGWMMDAGLLRPQQVCPKCSRDTIRKKTATRDRFRWRCRAAQCNGSHPIRNGSLFFGSKCSLEALLRIVYGWVHHFSQELCAKESGVHINSVWEWHTHFRKIIYETEYKRTAKSPLLADCHFTERVCEYVYVRICLLSFERLTYFSFCSRLVRLVKDNIKVFQRTKKDVCEKVVLSKTGSLYKICTGYSDENEEIQPGCSTLPSNANAYTVCILR